jgi:hypothetical protein
MDRRFTLEVPMEPPLTMASLEGALATARQSGVPGRARVAAPHLLSLGMASPVLRVEWADIADAKEDIR